MRIIDFKKQPCEAARFAFYDEKGFIYPLPTNVEDYMGNVDNFQGYCDFVYSLINHAEYLNENDDNFEKTKFLNYLPKYLKILYVIK